MPRYFRARDRPGAPPAARFRHRTALGYPVPRRNRLWRRLGLARGSMDTPGDSITVLLRRLAAGEPRAAEQLPPLVCEALRSLVAAAVP